MLRRHKVPHVRRLHCINILIAVTIIYKLINIAVTRQSKWFTATLHAHLNLLVILAYAFKFSSK